MNTTTSRGANAAVLPVLRSALVRALQWRLWLLFAAASLLCALLAALPAWNWLAGTLNHSVQADAIAAGKAPALLLDALMSRDAPHGVIGESVSIAALLMLLLSPLLAGATVAAARSRTRLGFGDLLRGAITEYGPMLRMLPPEHWPRADDDPRQLVERLLLLARRMSPKQLATSKRKPKSAQAKGYVDGSIARSHVSTARVLKQAAGTRP